jgi:hypothetical protein
VNWNESKAGLVLTLAIRAERMIGMGFLRRQGQKPTSPLGLVGLRSRDPLAARLEFGGKSRPYQMRRYP